MGAETTAMTSLHAPRLVFRYGPVAVALSLDLPVWHSPRSIGTNRNLHSGEPQAKKLGEMTPFEITGL